MFDKLIESEPEGADFKNRRSYFLVSTVAVGILFLAAVVISIYAADYRLGNTSFELTDLIVPVEMAAAIPEPPKPQIQSAPSENTNSSPSRKVNMSRTDEPTIVPQTISTARTTEMARPNTDYKIGTVDTNPNSSPGVQRPTVDGTGGEGGLATGPATVAKVEIPLPPIEKLDPPKPPQPPAIKSLGVINGRATSLPKPNYPATAVSMNVQGKVDVQVMIDESGKVVSASAVTGHPLLRSPAVAAARNARFSPTLLSNVPVKVTGVIVYNFSR